MVRIELKGIASATAKGRTYYYAWRGGPRIHGAPGTPEFMQSYHEAHENHRTPDAGRFRSLVVMYKQKPFKVLAPSTQRNWARFLDRIGEHFGDLRIAQFDRPEKIRPLIRQWRNQWEDTPRTADYAMQVLSRVLSYAVDQGKIAGNPCEGIKPIYTGDRSEIIWQPADIAQLKKTCSPDIANAVDLASHTGLRRGDLIRLSWSHVGEDAITITTGKSKHRRTAIIPLYDDLRDVLARIPKRSTTILTNGRLPWTDNQINSAFSRAKNAAGMNERDLNFNDLRGTAITILYIARIPLRVIAEVVAWEESNVEKIIRRYVGRAAANQGADPPDQRRANISCKTADKTA